MRTTLCSYRGEKYRVSKVILFLLMKKNIIPLNAEKVFSGIRTEIYQWDQEMYDGSIERFERMRFID